jgi:site-specific DNA-cytosine methylase
VPVPVPYVDVLCGGFPCQDISVAGRGEGIDGARSGLWGEYARLIRELRPRYVVVENVAALLARGMERVLGDLAACGYDAEWDCIPASAVGAPHRRDRVWLVAYPRSQDAKRAGATDYELSRDRDKDLLHVRIARMWPTPTTQDAANDGGPSQFERNSLPLNAAVKTTTSPPAGGSLNPTWVEWLMGFPLGWTDLRSLGAA